MSSSEAQSDHERKIEKTITGSCQCGFIKYSFTGIFPVNPETGNVVFTATRCNCTNCQKFRTTSLDFSGKGPGGQVATFNLISPASLDDPGLGKYSSKDYSKTAPRYFCKTCGAHCWIDGYIDYAGNKFPRQKINLATVDQPQDGVDLSEVKVLYYDLLHDNIQGGLRDTPWSGGLS